MTVSAIGVEAGLPVIAADKNPGPFGGASTAGQVTVSTAGAGIFNQTNVPGAYTFSVCIRLISGS
jgi:hypothetical protein